MLLFAVNELYTVYLNINLFTRYSLNIYCKLKVVYYFGPVFKLNSRFCHYSFTVLYFSK